jgi:hypothetical protein
LLLVLLILFFIYWYSFFFFFRILHFHGTICTLFSFANLRRAISTLRANICNFSRSVLTNISKLLSHGFGKDWEICTMTGRCLTGTQAREAPWQREEWTELSMSHCFSLHCRWWLWVRMGVTVVSWAVSFARNSVSHMPLAMVSLGMLFTTCTKLFYLLLKLLADWVHTWDLLFCDIIMFHVFFVSSGVWTQGLYLEPLCQPLPHFF